MKFLNDKIMLREVVELVEQFSCRSCRSCRSARKNTGFSLINLFYLDLGGGGRCARPQGWEAVGVGAITREIRS